MQKLIDDPVSLGWSDSHPLFRIRHWIWIKSEPIHVLLWRKVADDVWAIRERYFESSINQANIYFFQVQTKFVICFFTNLIILSHREAKQIFWLTQGLAFTRYLLELILPVKRMILALSCSFQSKLTIHQLPPFLSSTGLRPNTSEKPMSVLITHMHFDHSGGAHQFKEVTTSKMNS